MFAYLLLRNNKQLGPYSLDELKSFGVKATDLVWIEGKSSAWLFPDEIEELQEIVHASSTNNRYQHNTSVDTKPETNTEGNFRFTEKNEKRNSFQPEKKFRPVQKDATEKDRISRTNIELRKNIFPKKETNFSFSKQQTDDNNRQNSFQDFLEPIRVIIADDHRLFREGVKTALSQKKDVRIIGEAENGMQLLNILKYNKPDVILLDIQMPVMDGISALTSIRKIYADMKVIILSMHEGHSMISTMMETGANGYLTKTADPETIYQAIKTCFEKTYYFNELTNISILEELRSKKKVHEKVNKSSFDGAEMMQRLTEAQKKSSNFYSSNSNTKVLIAVCSALLIGAGIIAGMNLLGNSTSSNIQAPAKIIDAPKLVNEEAHSSTALPATITDSSKKQSPDSLQKNILPPENKKSDAEKHVVKKTEDLTNKQVITPVQKNDSAIKQNENAAVKQSSPVADTKSITKDAIRNLLTASANQYHVGAFGGLSDIEITISNHSDYIIDEAVVEVRYILSNSKLYKTETLNFHDIQASSSKMLKAPKSPRGETLEYKIISIKSKDLDL